MSTEQPTPYKIEAAPLDRYSRGWHCLGHRDDYTEKPVLLEYFGTSLVAYRGQDDGELHVLDAFCPHMGGNLSMGCVQGNSLRCPFHDWSWGADGICNDIPYAKRIPEKAVIKSWPTLEKNNLVFVWNDPEGGEPIAEQEPEVIAEVESDEWTDWVMTKETIHTNCRELVDNMADVAHFGPVHHSPANRFVNIVDQHTYTQQMWGTGVMDKTMELFSEARYEGPAYMTTYMWNQGEMTGNVKSEKRLLVTHVPIDHESFDLRFGVMVKRIPGMSEADEKTAIEEIVMFSQYGFFQDVEIWHSKTRVDNPVLCDGDGPVNKLRQWYNQFYTDRAGVNPNTFSRKEYEVELSAEVWAHLKPRPEALAMMENRKSEAI
jgi:3-ketosteroid 9alpha-monooxygenase subunit A